MPSSTNQCGGGMIPDLLVTASMLPLWSLNSIEGALFMPFVWFAFLDDTRKSSAKSFRGSAL